jgi:outer membrane protein TolC
MRWKALVMGLGLAFLAAVGCKQQCFLTQADYDEFQHTIGLPPNLANDPSVGITPVIPSVPPPVTVDNPDRQPWYLTLNEAVAIALENGTTGVESVRVSQPGNLPINDDLVSFTGNGVSGVDSIRVFAMQPAIQQASIEFQIGRFDPAFVTSMSWASTDLPVQGLTSFQNGETANFLSGFIKPLPTGGYASVNFTTQYQNLTRPPTGFNVTNPAYSPQLTFGFEQPLIRDWGVDINQVIPTLAPAAGLGVASQLAAAVNGRRPGLLQTANEGILISRIRFDQSRADFERHVAYMLVNVETAYWTLYGSYVDLYSKEQALRQAYETWRISKAKYEAGSINITSFAQTRGQYEKFRGDRLQSLDQVLENERTLRALLGLPIEDGKRIIPVDTPTVAPYLPDWESALRDAMELRPELVLAREELKAKQLQVQAQLNFMKPDLRSFANYAVNGLGDRLDGSGSRVDNGGVVRSDNALRDLASDHFTNWTVGLQLTVPLGYRQESAALRQARLSLAQSFWQLRDMELRSQRFLAAAYREVGANYDIIKARRASRIAYAEELEGRFKEFISGKATQQQGAGGAVVDFLLQAQTDWTTALSAEYVAIQQYNISLARFEFARGTMLKHDSVVIQEGPLPRCAQVRAVEHEKQRALAIVLREREHPVPYQNCSADQGKPAMPLLPSAAAPSLPALMGGTPNAPTTPLPSPEQIQTPPSPVPGPKTGPGPGSSSAPLPSANTSFTTLPAASPPALPARLPTAPPAADAAGGHGPDLSTIVLPGSSPAPAGPPLSRP